MTERFYRLYFGTDENANVSVKVPNAFKDAGAAAVKSAMDEIVNGAMAGSSKGVFTEAKRATYTETETTEFDVA